MARLGGTGTGNSGARGGSLPAMPMKCRKHNFERPGDEPCPYCDIERIGDLKIELGWSEARLKALDEFMLNSITIIGNLTTEPQLRRAASNTAILSMRIKAQNPDEKLAFFIDLEAWGDMAEKAHDQLAKGSKVYVEGSLKQNKWKFQGKKYEKVVVKCGKIIPISPHKSVQKEGQEV